MNSSTKNLPTIGFIGTGTLTTALVTGFCSRAAEKPYPIVLSPRNREKAAALQAEFPDRVKVAETFQEVADKSDWLVLAVLPSVGEEVCRGIKFRPTHKVINMLADRSLQEIRSWIGPTEVLVHMVPVTYNAVFSGPIIQTPPQAEAAEIFADIGSMVQVEERQQAAVLAAITACVAPYFTLLSTLIKWASSQGVPEELAADYVKKFFQGLTEQAIRSGNQSVHELAAEFTPGGTNFMVKEMLTEQGVFAAWARAMEPVLARLTANFS
ncbi:MAG: NAD(P)-binding domain-containing protein [Ruminococcaceae bacterium]|nr:NAD(P)-binding domain-containing protein [Oscillospiraceae bacterium]